MSLECARLGEVAQHRVDHGDLALDDPAVAVAHRLAAAAHNVRLLAAPVAALRAVATAGAGLRSVGAHAAGVLRVVLQELWVNLQRVQCYYVYD